MRLNTEPHLDEIHYWVRAEAWTQVFHGHLGYWPQAYGKGIWPPLHPFLLGLAGLLAPGSLALARLVSTLFSIGTTWMLFRLGFEVGGNRVGILAAFLHAIYVPLIFFSPLLYSELFDLFLLVSALTYLVRFVKEGATRDAAICGALLGLMVLTRATAIFLPPAFLLAAFLLRRNLGVRALLLVGPAVVLCAGWMTVMRLQSGRWIVMSSSGGYNMYLGNNPHMPPKMGSAWAQGRILPILQGEMIAETGSRHMADWDLPGRRRALETIRANPVAAMQRSVWRVRDTLKPDYYLRRYLHDGIYPAEPWLYRINDVGRWEHFAILILGLVGLFKVRYRSVFILLCMASLVGPMISIGASRFGLPIVVALMVPAATALACIFRKPVDAIAGVTKMC